MPLLSPKWYFLGNWNSDEFWQKNSPFSRRIVFSTFLTFICLVFEIFHQIQCKGPQWPRGKIIKCEMQSIILALIWVGVKYIISTRGTLSLLVYFVNFVNAVTWMSLSSYMDLSKLINWFHYVVILICQNSYMDFSNSLHGFVKVVSWICQSCSMYFSPFVKLN